MAEYKSNNQKVNALLAAVRTQVANAQTETDLIKAIEDVKAFGAPIKFNHLINYIIAAVLGCLSVLGFLYLYQNGKHANNLVTFATALLVMFSIGTLTLIYSKNKKIRTLEDYIFNRDLQLDNRLTPVAVSAEQHARELGFRFHEFNRGNYSREIRALYQASYQGKEYSFDYHFYHFHYVDKRTTMHTNSKGQWRTKTVYDHYDRYGLYLPFHFISNLALISKSISGVSGYNYKPASIQFNKIYKVIAESEIAAAKFLKPTVVLACEQIAQSFREVNFEFNEETELCMSFRDDDVLTLERKHGFDRPDEFIQEIKGVQILPKLQIALEHIHTLMTYSDNNFRKDNP